MNLSYHDANTVAATPSNPCRPARQGGTIKPPRQIRPDRSAPIVHVVGLLAQPAVTLSDYWLIFSSIQHDNRKKA